MDPNATPAATPPADPAPATPAATPPVAAAPTPPAVTPPAAQPAAPAAPAQAPAAPEGPKGTPSADQKAARIEQENKELKASIRAITDKLGITAPETAPTVDVDAIQRQYDLDATKWAVEKELLAAGCDDLIGAVAHIDLTKIKRNGDQVEGFDREAFKKDHPRYFGTTTPPATVSTGGTPGGAGGGGTPMTIREAAKDYYKQS